MKNINFTVGIKAICEPSPVLDVVAVDEHFDVVSHFALVVEHVPAHAGPTLEVALEQLGDGIDRERRGRALRVPRQVLREVQIRHEGVLQAAERASTWYGESSGNRQFASGISTVVTSACCPVSTEWLMPSVNTIQADSGGKWISW